MPDIIKKYYIKAGNFEQAGDAALQIKGVLKSVGIVEDIVRRVAICAYESEMNIVMHGGDGTVTLNVDPSVVVIKVRDEGNGIDDVELACQEGYSTALAEHREMGFGAGMGLPNIRKSSDSCEIISKQGRGTCLIMHFWRRKN
jgi:serine/threonine-protein kinase RsbT